jgi:hypothetical protein
MKHTFVILAVFVVAITARAQDSTIKSSQVYSYAGVPASGTSEVDTLTITGTGGSFTITVAGGRTTPAINWSATNATLLANVDAALEGLSAIGSGGVTTAAGTLTTGTGTITLTFAGKNAKKDMPALTTTSALVTGSASIATTTPGVAATFPNASPGTLLIDSSTPGLYQNTSATVNSPTWTQIVVP